MIVFSGATLNRAPAERRSAGWLAGQRADPRARSLQLSEVGVWVEDGRLLLAPPAPGAVFLGLADDTPLFAADVTGVEPGAGRPAGLREVATELPADEAALASYAASLLAWHRRHRFCANCGAPTEPRAGGHERACAGCEAHHFPRTDPVVIVLVTDPEGRLLMGRQPQWPEGRFSLLAGFVEPGETLEEAVRREILEESGVEVDAVEYLASQPWPFPSSLMLGFGAVAEDAGEPSPVDDELSEVRWFEREEIERAARDEGDGELVLPPPYSIAGWLIGAWLAEPA